jgi:hypothetical protein
MNKQQMFFDELKEAYLEVTVPDTLDDAIRRGVLKGKNQMNGRKLMEDKRKKRRGMRAVAAVAAAFMILVASVNLSPAFAEQLSGIPIIGQLVKVLIFTEGSATGGTITDGSDISGVSTDKKGNSETFTIHFEQGSQPQTLAGAYKVVYAQHPETLSFQISGVRMFSAVEDFEAMKKSGLVADVYRVITLDDSMIRFVMVFKEPVVYEIKEMQNPASLVLQVSAKGEAAANTTPYRLRTMEMPFGESLGITEEMLMPMYTEMRILRTATDSENYFIELGQFESQESAEAALEKAKASYPDMALQIEAVPVNQ